MLLLLAGLCGGAIVAAAPDIAGAALLLLLPGLLVLWLDPTPGRAIGRTVLLFEAAGSVRPVTAAWLDCDGLRQCMAMATGIRTILAVLLFAGGGVLLTVALPMVLSALDGRRTRARLERLARQRQALQEEWEFFT